MEALGRRPSPSRLPFAGALGVIGSAPHWRDKDGLPVAYEPYVREMRVWADLFESVEIYGPEGRGARVANLAAYDRPNIRWRPVSYALADGFAGKMTRLAQLPKMAWDIAGAVRRHPFLLLRSPDHLSLVGAVLVRAMGRPSLTKWAGENGAFPGERLPSRVQRWVEALPPRRHRVLVYGPARRANQLSFVPALMSSEEIARAQRLSRERPDPPPFRILSVGRLDAVKGFALALRGLGRLAQRRPDLQWRYTLVGDGPESDGLRELAAREAIAERVRFAGAKSFEQVQEEYAGAHLSIMPGVQEGWPKTIAESWAHGVFPVAARAGLVPWILGEPGRGMLFDPSAEGLAVSLEAAMEAPSPRLPQDLRRLAADLSLESFRDRLEEILSGLYGLSRVDGSR